MATIYVRKSGNDSTGNGTTGAPYLTLRKALRVAASGDTILMGVGTYAEDGQTYNDSAGPGYLVLGNAFTSFVQVWPEPAGYGLGEVVITGTSGSYVMAFGSTNFVSFHNIVLRSTSEDTLAIVRFLAANMADVVFDRCRFDVFAKSGQTNLAAATAWTGSGYSVARIAFSDCEVREIGPGFCGGLLIDNAGSATVTDFQILNSKITVGNFGVRLMGLTRCVVMGNHISSASSLTSGTALQLGVDGATGAAISGVVGGNTITARLGHGAVIGAGISDMIFEDNVVFGGSNSGAGQGLVVKNATGARVRRNIIHGGYLSGLYLKACQNCLFEENTIYNRYAPSPALRVGINSEDNSKVANNVIRGNTFHAPIGSLISWDDAAGDAGGGICDQNVYTVSGAGTFGTVRGTAVSSLATIRAAWAGYDEPYNDSGSRTGLKAVCERGDRRVHLV